MSKADRRKKLEKLEEQRKKRQEEKDIEASAMNALDIITAQVKGTTPPPRHPHTVDDKVRPEAAPATLLDEEMVVVERVESEDGEEDELFPVASEIPDLSE